MGYAVLHSEKGSISSGGIGNHIDRKKGAEHSYRHADLNKTHLNLNIKMPKDRHKMELSDAIADRIKEGYKGKRAIRKDAVKYITHVLTGTHEDMTAIFADEKKKNAWIKDNLNFIRDEFGADNLVRFSVHLDEKTPHIHAVTVPLTPDGRLSAKEIFGNRKKLQSRQDRYAETMEKYGLKRGVRNTGIKHEDAKDYYKRINIENEQEIKPPRRVLGVFEGKGVMEQTETLKSLKNAFKQNEVEKQRYIKRNVELHKQLEEEKTKNNHYKNNPYDFVRAVERENNEEKMDYNHEFAIRISEYLQRNPSELNHQENVSNPNYILNKLFTYHTEKHKFDVDFINDNMDLFKDIDRRKGNVLETNLNTLQRLSARKLKEQEDRERRTKQKQSQEERTERRKRGYRR